MPKRPPPQVKYVDYGEDGLPVEIIAALEHVSPSRIRTIISRAMAKLRRECAKRGIRPEDVLGHPVGE